MQARPVAAALLVAAGLVACASGALISQVSPRMGSFAGGTEVTILGSGFNRGGIEVRRALLPVGLSFFFVWCVPVGRVPLSSTATPLRLPASPTPSSPASVNHYA